jgi:hypothetical protein
MTYHVGLGPGIHPDLKPRRPHITCDGCGLVHDVAGRNGPFVWFLDGKAPPKWRKRDKLHFCPRCKEAK